MRSLRLALGLGLALVGGQALAAAPAKTVTFDVRTQITWDPSGRVWIGALPAQRCSARMIPISGQSQARTADYIRQGELVAEFHSPRRLTPVVIAGAQACATEAANATGTPALLSAAEAPFQAFRGAYAACLGRVGSAEHLGSMRLWVETRCDW